MDVFKTIQSGEPYDIRQEDYQKEVHGEINRCDHSYKRCAGQYCCGGSSG